MYKTKTGLSRKNIREYAEATRAYVGLENQLDVPIVKMIEMMVPQICDEFSHEVVENWELDADAKYYPSKKFLRIRQSVYDAACDGDGRARFTLAHELGHILMHDEDNIALARNQEDIPAYRDLEWQANTFAAELLAPPRLIVGLTEDEIMDKCKVSKRVAQIQKKYTNRY